MLDLPADPPVPDAPALELRGSAIPMREQDVGRAIWSGGHPNQLSSKTIAYPQIDAIHQGTKLDSRTCRSICADDTSAPTTRLAVAPIFLHRALTDRDFSLREQALFSFFHGELGRLISGPLVSGIEPGPGQLSPPLRQTLQCLIEGDSEKQVAERLRLSRAATHQCVTSLYRRFDVQSRGHLMAHVIRRLRSRRLGIVRAFGTAPPD
ncbi:MAG: hypothetical protein ACRD7E_16770 [Bryobacteraceae bacterium]